MPFTQEQFISVFFSYNTSVWPMQVFLNLLAIISLFLIIKKFSIADKFVNSVLTFLWLWMGIVYHIFYFSEINPAANIFAILFIAQAILFLFFGVLKDKLTYTASNSYLSFIGFLFILFALFIYPFLGLLFNHTYPSSPTFGLPCPTTIFTFGILLFSKKKIPFYLFIIPLLWSLIGFTAALNLGIYEDTGLLAAGLIGSILILFIINRRELVPL